MICGWRICHQCHKTYYVSNNNVYSSNVIVSSNNNGNNKARNIAKVLSFSAISNNARVLGNNGYSIPTESTATATLIKSFIEQQQEQQQQQHDVWHIQPSDEYRKGSTAAHAKPSWPKCGSSSGSFSIGSRTNGQKKWTFGALWTKKGHFKCSRSRSLQNGLGLHESRAVISCYSCHSWKYQSCWVRNCFTHWKGKLL